MEGRPSNLVGSQRLSNTSHIQFSHFKLIPVCNRNLLHQAPVIGLC
jgi:hypothetical protein